MVGAAAGDEVLAAAAPVEVAPLEVAPVEEAPEARAATDPVAETPEET